jgi:multidrug efflux pump subunit AcrA (membrane-fusion protein)
MRLTGNQTGRQASDTDNNSTGRQAWRQRFTGRTLLIAVGFAIVALVAAGSQISRNDRVDAGGRSPFPTSLATVTRQTLSSQVWVDGVLGYGESLPVSAAGGGTLTWIAPIGSTVERGQPLFEVDGQPIPLLHGSVPLFRTLRAGATEGGELRDARAALREAELNLRLQQERLNELLESPSASAKAAAEQAVAQAETALEAAQEVLRRAREGPTLEDRMRAQQAVLIAQSQLAQAQSGGNTAAVQAAQIELQLAQQRLALLNAPDEAEVRAAERGVKSAEAGLDAALAAREQAYAGPKAADLASARLAVLQAERQLTVARERLDSLQAQVMALGSTDVLQLQTNLAEMGYTGFSVDGVYDQATADAVRAWQADLGLPVTGALEPGGVVFAPGPLRVIEHVTRVGGTVGGATGGGVVLKATSTTPVVTIALDPALQSRVSLGDSVTVTLPDRQTTSGAVSSIGSVATSESSTSGSGGSKATIAVKVELSDPAAAGRLDQAPVSVAITTARVENALVVPVTALLAMADGGHAVELAHPDGTRQLIPVKTGLFDSSRGLVAVTAEGLDAGQQVVVPGGR